MQYNEDWAGWKENGIFCYNYPDTLCEEFLKLDLDKEIQILDVACGPGNVSQIVISI